MILNVLKSEKFSTVIIALSCAVASIAALFVVINTRALWREQIESNRPYLAIIGSGIAQLPESTQYRIHITIQNVGVRPAYDLYGKIFLIETDLESEPTNIFDLSISNEIPANVPNLWYNDTLRLSADIPPQYIIAAIEYSDPVLKKSFSQTFYMKWNGIEEG
ncbi:hypothetical protein ACFL55_02765 [Candidatus Latescibacterota bacterium]